jgi:glutathione-regulated potassium-efflux system ancillary protein KefG
MARVLILFAHPALQKSRVNRHLARAVQEVAGVTFHDLYERYPDLHLNVQTEQRLLVEHDVIVLQHPFYWYSSPAILKEWQDLVLERGFAYGDGGTALRGKKLLTAITTGGPEETYQRAGANYFTIRELLAPFEQMARLCGMDYVPPFVLHALPTKDRATITQATLDYRQMIEALRDDTLDWTAACARSHLNAGPLPLRPREGALA